MDDSSSRSDESRVKASLTGMVLVPIFFANERIDKTLPGKYSPMINDHFTLW